MMLTALLLAATDVPITTKFLPKTKAVLTSYGDCLARKAADLEPSGAPARDLIAAATTACKTYQETSLVAIMVDLEKSSDPAIRANSDASAEKSLEYIEQQMRDDLMLQILERRSEQNKHAKN